ncbi:MAG: hypothetical protein KF745_00705 [Phycisphaeraceae bacterium]|nr:hypothetical protein [Phycisphaeraceae bacterium]
MTPTQRRIHAALWTVLGAALLIALAGALLARPAPVAPASSTPGARP